MILPIYLYGNPILRKKSEDIDKNYPDLKQLIDNMFETMYHSNGVGLAAPQIGLNINLLVLDASPFADDDPICKGFKRVMINPQVTFEGTKKIVFEEGCLSVPNIHEEVTRYNDIIVTYFNENFEEVTEKLSGNRAVVVQHEFDHLQGIVFCDKINPIRKHFLKNRLSDISKGKVKTSYRVKVN
ncbi:MAG: peptide deformylase [Bacteroidales bacterium]|nr:peptide deformylase [Bacteroidales bacterium]MBQ2350591.1 peptide deformylase [Bacteroidales bacterium]MBQ2573747.1 peptide deformylase [Bacteroidales bacterium]